MYDVAKFISAKREDWDNGCGPTERADLEALRYERAMSLAGVAVRAHLLKLNTPRGGASRDGNGKSSTASWSN